MELADHARWVSGPGRFAEPGYRALTSFAYCFAGNFSIPSRDYL
jgi:hypothetical protein